jgi:uncharacterized protein (DUF1800 family)
MALLTLYTKPLTAAEVGHLLRRTTFGPTPAQIKALTGQTATQIVNTLLAGQPVPAPPITADTLKTFHDQPFDTINDGRNRTYVKAWWLGLMLNQPVSIVEKMTLFWSNHFATNTSTVNDYRYMYRYNALLRQHALGNFRAFTIAITQDPAMLRFLDGNQNVATRPQENYGRELQELFVTGTGVPYTEADVKAATRVLTGWRDTGYRDAVSGTTVGATFAIDRHDKTDKAFSAAYNNTVIRGRTDANAGLTELTELVNMLLATAEAPRHLCRKLYRWFVNSDITATVEAEVIQPMADVFKANDFNIKPVMQALLTSTHFFDPSLRGAMIKNPVDLVVGTMRFWNTPVPTLASEPTAFYTLTSYAFARAREQQQELLEPPTVFGWTAYYQPDYYQQWINSTTLGYRGSYTDVLSAGAYRLNNKPVVDILPLVQTLPAPQDAARLVADLLGLMLAVPLSATQLQFLTNTVLLNNLPDYEWPTAWNDYMAAPTNTAKRNVVLTKLTAFLQYVFRMAEYQLL